MRIISGQLKGRRLVAPKQLPVRPTTDRAKEALFNILNHHFTWSEIGALDLFSGTGNIAYELASRGVTDLWAVDQNHHCTRYIRTTAEQLDLPIQTIKKAAVPFLEKCGRTFDFVFADPPYAFKPEDLAKIIQLVTEGTLLNEGGIFVLEHDKHQDLSQISGCFDVRHYGNSSFSFFEKK